VPLKSIVHLALLVCDVKGNGDNLVHFLSPLIQCKHYTTTGNSSQELFFRIGHKANAPEFRGAARGVFPSRKICCNCPKIFHNLTTTPQRLASLIYLHNYPKLYLTTHRFATIIGAAKETTAFKKFAPKVQKVLDKSSSYYYYGAAAPKD
jgi:hypothetical protein